ncbi:aminopeptidase [Salinimicrobium marinum]|uniref:Aminopeptidase N n=1 Tax=Salinimicrobium marinum TaxID=680283 RepID=A0A918SEF0_9FLAO|nr:M1 family metallopeptidase [Salinimicrobium marinum]GHA37435.1 aminopeptidase [Salinimicrobium marinum]
MKRLFAIFIFFLLISFGSYGQQTSLVDFQRVKAELAVFPSEKKVEGRVTFRFDVLETTDSVFIDARKMDFREVKLNGKEVDFSKDEQRLWIVADFTPTSDNVLEFNYTATPSQGMYFEDWDISEEEKETASENSAPQVWTQGQGRYTSNWLPSFDDTTEKLEFDLTVDFQKGFEVIANGKLQKSAAVNDSVVRWEYDMEQPMSSYLVALAAGKYQKKEISSSSGVPIQLYYYPGDEGKVEPTYRHTKQIFDFLEKQTGVAYPWQNYKQIPVRDFLYAGMENTGTTIFSDLFVVDSTAFKDRNYVNVNAHELAHQWFGDLVTAASGEHHWLQEGFSTYYALLAEREVFGDDYYYWKLFESAEELKELSDSGKGEALINSKASSLTYYQKGAWALHILKERVGEEAFNLAVKNYLNKYKFKNVTTADFIAEVENTSGKDLSAYVLQWLEQSAFPATVALNSLKESKFITDYLQIAALKEFPLQEKKELLNAALNFPVNQYVGQEVIYQLALTDPLEAIELYEKAFETNDIYVRQAIAASLRQIPQELKSYYESLLKDDSYVTKEMAFYNLWFNFPEERSEYLDRLKEVEGFNDKNVETLWLALNLATAGYQMDDKQSTYAQLSGYTSPYYPYQIRQNAFNYLFQLNSFSDENLFDLVEASQHQVGRFRESSRQLLRELVQSEEYQQRFSQLKPSLSAKESGFLEQILP